MKASQETKRLFVGGLSQSIAEADLRSQFSRFGDVSDVEIITRKDEQGECAGLHCVFSSGYCSQVNVGVSADPHL